MTEEKTRVDFNAPASLVEEADAVAELLDTSRTRLLVDALRGQIDEVVGDEGFRRRVTAAFYDGRIDADTVTRILGEEEGARLAFLRSSLERDPPIPAADAIEVPSREHFYDGDLPTWTAGDADDVDESGGERGDEHTDERAE